MAKFGTDLFGSASYGGDPAGPSGLLFDIDAEATTELMRLVARGSTDGTSVRFLEFSLGQGGVDPFDYKEAVPVNPDAQTLELPLTLAKVALPGTLGVIATVSVVTTTQDLTDYLRPGYLVEITTGSGTETLTVESVTAAQFVVTTQSSYTDPVATGVIDTLIAGAKNISEYEHPNPNSACAYCGLDKTEANEVLSEIGIWGKIVWSPNQHEIDTTFLAAIGHFPIVCKNSTMDYALRVNIQL